MIKIQKLTQYYRWQFLRLNKHYQRDSELYSKAIKALNKSRKISETKREERISKLENELYKRYGINGVYDYRLKKPHRNLRIYGDRDFPIRRGTLASIFKGKLKDNQQILGNRLLETQTRQREISKGKGKIKMQNIPLISPKFVQVVINYDAGITDIRNEIDKIIIPTKDMRREELGIKQPTTHTKHFKNLYEEYLKVWTLRNAGFSNKDVARKVFPDEKNPDLDEEGLKRGRKRAPEDKASKHFKEAIALINGGYKEITFQSL
ncbi:hypothetical protein ACFL5X_01155 [Candidatus Omnitrophota bacterium]